MSSFSSLAFPCALVPLTWLKRRQKSIPSAVGLPQLQPMSRTIVLLDNTVLSNMLTYWTLIWKTIIRELTRCL